MIHKKLNSRGITHLLIPLAVVVLIAAVGTYTYVNSKAASPLGSRSRIVSIAKKQIGYKEIEGPVENKVKYFNWQGDTPDYPGLWCSVFASWVWNRAGVKLDGKPYPNQPAVETLRDIGKHDNRFHAFSRSYKPRKGDAILYGQQGGDHIGIVVGVANNGRKIATVEGNSKVGAQTKDIHVVYRIINLNNPVNVPWGVIYGFVAPPGT